MADFGLLMVELERFALGGSVAMIGCITAAGLSMAKPDAARAEARPPAAVGFRFDLGEVLVIDEKVDDVDSVGAVGSFSLLERPQGRRFFVPPTE